MKQEYKECNFEEKVKWNDSFEEEFVCKLIDYSKSSEANPISKPHLVVIAVLGFQGFKGFEGGVDDPYKFANNILASSNKCEKQNCYQ